MKGLFAFLTLWLLVFTASSAHAGKITGLITDAQSGDPIPGATIGIKGTSFGAATGFNGKYLLLNAPGHLFAKGPTGAKELEQHSPGSSSWDGGCSRASGGYAYT